MDAIIDLLRLDSKTRKLHKKVRCIRLVLVLSDSHYDICLMKLRLKHLISTFMIDICDDNMIEAPISLLFPSYLYIFPHKRTHILSLISFCLLAPQNCLLPIFSLICPIRGFRMNLDDVFGVGDKSDYVVVLGEMWWVWWVVGWEFLGMSVIVKVIS